MEIYIGFGFPSIEGNHFAGPQKKDCNIWGRMSESPIHGNYQIYTGEGAHESISASSEKSGILRALEFREKGSRVYPKP